MGSAAQMAMVRTIYAEVSCVTLYTKLCHFWHCRLVLSRVREHGSGVGRRHNGRVANELCQS